MPDELRVRRVAPREPRAPFLPLLLLADEPEPLQGYLNDGDLYVPEATGAPGGVALLPPVTEEPGTVELKAIAVAAGQHNRGLGRRCSPLSLPICGRAGFAARSSAPAALASGRSRSTRKRISPPGHRA